MQPWMSLVMRVTLNCHVVHTLSTRDVFVDNQPRLIQTDIFVVIAAFATILNNIPDPLPSP